MRPLSSFLSAALLATGLLGLSACEQATKVPNLMVKNTDVQLFTTSPVRLADGRTVNVHLVNNINLTIEEGNRYMRLMNSLTPVQEKAHDAEAAALLKQMETPAGFTAANQDRLWRLMGHANTAEAEALVALSQREFALLKEEDPTYVTASKQEKLAMHVAVATYNRLHGGPVSVDPLGSPTY